MLVFDAIAISLSRYAREVSILVLVDVGLRPRSSQGPPPPTTSFNPCFSGCWSSTQAFVSFQAHSKYVSILVLVDVGLRLFEWKYYGPYSQQFQSLF